MKIWKITDITADAEAEYSEFVKKEDVQALLELQQEVLEFIKAFDEAGSDVGGSVWINAYINTLRIRVKNCEHS